MIITCVTPCLFVNRCSLRPYVSAHLNCFLFAGFWCSWQGNTDTKDAVAFLTILTEIPESPSLSVVLDVLDRLSKCVNTDSNSASNSADCPSTAMRDTIARLTELVLRDSTAKLAEVVSWSANSEEAKAQLNVFFPVAPTQTVNAVTALRASGAALCLDTNSMQVSTKALAEQSRNYAIVASFDVTILSHVSPDLCAQMTDYISQYEAVLAQLLSPDSDFRKSLQSFSDTVEKFRFLA